MEKTKIITGLDTQFLPNKFKRILMVFSALILYYIIFYILDPYHDGWQDYFNRNFSAIILEWFVSLLLCALISESSIFIHKKLNRFIPWTRNRSRRLMIEVLLNFGVVIILVLANMLYFEWTCSNSSEIRSLTNIDNVRAPLQWIIITLAISFMLISVNTVSFLLNNWIYTSMEMSEHKIQAVELRHATAEAELNALKLQLDPHFIFNNLSVLSELILEDQQLGYQYSENFSKVYRFLLVNSKKNVISLEEEMKFLDAYIFLINHRVGSGVNFSIDIPTLSKNLYIPPLTLQLLIENAIKHNSTSRKKPLMIRIYSQSAASLVIENTLSPIDNSQITSTGIGLNNIIKRFKLLGQQEPVVSRELESFKVSIQLIEYDKGNCNY